MTIRIAPYATLHDARLEPDPTRTVPRLIVPFEGNASSYKRTEQLAQRIKAIPAADTEKLVAVITKRFGYNFDNFTGIMKENARIIDAVLKNRGFRDNYQEILLGATFTAEFAPEAVAICNPSAVAHPDQNNLPEGSLRIAMGARAIGEGHISSICFFEAIVDAQTWRFLPHHRHLALASIDNGHGKGQRIDALREDLNRKVEMASTTVGETIYNPSTPSFIGEELEGFRRWRKYVMGQTKWAARRQTKERLYQARFSAETKLSQRILLPEVKDEAHGLEDARLVSFSQDDGETQYLGSYVAFDGRVAAPRLIKSKNLREFEIHRLNGPATKDKGLAFFPRKVNGKFLALTRTDWQDIALATSDDGYTWRPTDVIYAPEQPWEILKTGNCGSPIELEDGWLVITHGVGALRSYSFGALLLDKHNPALLKAKLTTPLVTTVGKSNTGYVPNAIYSCGGIVHDHTLWLPFSESDNRIRIASVEIDKLLSKMTSVSSSA